MPKLINSNQVCELARGRFLNKSSHLDPGFSVIKFTLAKWYDFGHTVVVLLKSDFNVQQTHLRAEGGFLNKSSLLDPSFSVVKFTLAKWYDICHTLLCYLCGTLMFNKPTSVL